MYANCIRQDRIIKNLLNKNITSLSNEFHKMFDKSDYVSTYSKLNYTSRKINNTIKYNILFSSDVISDIRIILPKKIFNKKLISSVELIIGGEIINKIYIDDIQHTITKILYSNINLEQSEESENISISLSLLVEMIPLLILYKNDIWINIILIDSFFIYNILNIELHATKYNITNIIKRRLFYEESYIFLTLQIQNMQNEKINIGRNEIIINFNHPIFLLCICGLNKSSIVNIHLKLLPLESNHTNINNTSKTSETSETSPNEIYNINNTYDTNDTNDTNDIYYTDFVNDIFFESNIEEIDSNLIFISFSNKINKFTKDNLFLNESINFSNLSKAILIIRTTINHKNCNVNIVGLNKNVSTYSKGRYLLEFSY